MLACRHVDSNFTQATKRLTWWLGGEFGRDTFEKGPSKERIGWLKDAYTHTHTRRTVSHSVP